MPLLRDLGYPVGFLMVVLGRQQLFTENTITMVLPVMAKPSAARLGTLGRVWGIILAGSMESFMLVANGELSPWRALTGFAIHVFLGNVFGGTVLFAMISHAQVMKEV